MNRFLLFSMLLLGCAASPRVAPRFTQPSTVTIARAHAVVKQRVQAAEVIVQKVGEECPQAKADVANLKLQLDGAISSLDFSESARSDLDKELAAQTQKANTLATNYDTLHAQDEKAQKIVKQVDRFWGIGALLYGFGRLATHMFILIAALAFLAVAMFVLSFFFPFLVPFVRMIGSFFGAIFNKVGGMFKR